MQEDQILRVIITLFLALAFFPLIQGCYISGLRDCGNERLGRPGILEILILWMAFYISSGIEW